MMCMHLYINIHLYRPKICIFVFKAGYLKLDNQLTCCSEVKATLPPLSSPQLQFLVKD